MTNKKFKRSAQYKIENSKRSYNRDWSKKMPTEDELLAILEYYEEGYN